MFTRQITRTIALSTRTAGVRSVSSLSPNLYTAVSTSSGSRAAG